MTRNEEKIIAWQLAIFSSFEPQPPGKRPYATIVYVAA
jgi:hypothetical protein